MKNQNIKKAKEKQNAEGTAGGGGTNQASKNNHQSQVSSRQDSLNRNVHPQARKDEDVRNKGTAQNNLESEGTSKLIGSAEVMLPNQRHINSSQQNGANVRNNQNQNKQSSQASIANQSQNRQSRYDENQRQEEDELMKSSSSFNLPSESFVDNISDKEILSDNFAARATSNRQSPQRINEQPNLRDGQERLNTTAKEPGLQARGFAVGENGMDISFDFENHQERKHRDKNHNMSVATAGLRNSNNINLSYKPIAQQRQQVQNLKALNHDVDDLSDLIESPGLPMNRAGPHKQLQDNVAPFDGGRDADIQNAKFTLPLYHNRHQQSLDKQNSRRMGGDEKDQTQSTQQPNGQSMSMNARKNPNLHINIQNLKQAQIQHQKGLTPQKQPHNHQPKNLLATRQISQHPSALTDINKKQDPRKQGGGQQSYFDRSADKVAPRERDLLGQQVTNQIGKLEGHINLNDDSYISAHSGLNLIGAGADTSFVFSENFNPQLYVAEKRLINNNYQNIVNLRQSQNPGQSHGQGGPSLQTGYLSKIISKQGGQESRGLKQVKVSPRLNLESIAEMQSLSNQNTQHYKSMTGNELQASARAAFRGEKGATSQVQINPFKGRNNPPEVVSNFGGAQSQHDLSQNFMHQDSIIFNSQLAGKRMSIMSLEDQINSGLNSRPEIDPLNLGGVQAQFQRGFSADSEVKSAQRRNYKNYEGTDSDGIYNTYGPLSMRESQNHFHFGGDSEYGHPSRKVSKLIQRYVTDDDSDRSKYIRMPDVTATKNQLQEEIGYLLSKNSDGLFKDEIQHNKQMEAETVAFYRIVDKDPLDAINDYHDRCPCLSLRKLLMKARIVTNRVAMVIISNRYFETASIAVICTNSLFLALDDPLTSTQPTYQSVMDDVFQYVYTIEMGLKIIGYGFIFNKGAYLRDAWNILDFIIIASGYLSIILQGGGVNLSVLRSFRVIRPLRTISSIQGLRVIVQALISSMPLLRDTILVLVFFFLVFAIAGVQLFAGVLLNRCFSIETGQFDPADILCGGATQCRAGQACGKSMENPNGGSTNFDNIFYGFLQVFQIVTLEGWTGIMIAVEATVQEWTVIYFIPIVFIGAFFLLNLTLAVIKSKFTEEHNKNAHKVVNQRDLVKKKKKLYGEESEDDDDNVINQGLDDDQQGAPLTKVQQRLKEIEEDQELSPRSKKLLKDKTKLEELMKRIDFAIKQREVKDKITPRGSSIYSFSQNSGEKYNSHFQHTQFQFGVAIPGATLNSHLAAQQLNANKDKARLNYADIFNSTYFKQLSYKDKESQAFRSGAEEAINPFMKFEDHQSSFSLQQQMTFQKENSLGSTSNKIPPYSMHLQVPGGKQGNSSGFKNNFGSTIKELEQEEQLSVSHEINALTLEQDAETDERKYARSDEKPSGTQNGKQGVLSRTQTITKNKVSPWLGQVFEIQRQPQNYQPPPLHQQQSNLDQHNNSLMECQPQSARLLMGGFAGIKAKKQFSEKADSDEIKRLKREIYEKIARNFNVLDFFEDGNPGDDEFSDDQARFLEDEYMDFQHLNSFGSSRKNRPINEDDLAELIEENVDNTPGNAKYNRKSTMATVETKSIKPRDFKGKAKDSLTDKHTSSHDPSNPSSTAQKNSSESLPGNEEPSDLNNITQIFSLHGPGNSAFLKDTGRVLGLNEREPRHAADATQIQLISGQNIAKRAQQKRINLLRRSTISPVKGQVPQMPIEGLVIDEEELKQQELEEKLNAKRKPARQSSGEDSLAKRAVRFFQGCTKRKQKRIEIIEAEVEELLKRSRSQQHAHKGASSAYSRNYKTQISKESGKVDQLLPQNEGRDDNLKELAYNYNKGLALHNPNSARNSPTHLGSKKKPLFAQILRNSKEANISSPNPSMRLGVSATTAGGNYQKIGLSLLQQRLAANIKEKTLEHSIRAKSEQRRDLQLQDQHHKFKLKEERMRKRRSKFFAQALQDIGKDPEQIQKELKDRAKKRRFIELKGGFTTTKRAKRKLLMRSGTQDFEQLELENEPSGQKKDLNNLDRYQGSKDQGFVEDFDMNANSQDRKFVFEREVQKFQKEIQHELDKHKPRGEAEGPAEDAFPDMEQVLKEKQKKLVVRMKNYKFASVNDIFEGRDTKQRDAIHSNINFTQKGQMIPRDLPAGVSDKPKAEVQVNASTKVKGWRGDGNKPRHKPYQRKIVQTQKRYFEDLLLNEQVSSDDNQDVILKRLEDEYNVDHRSNIHVTGTLSIVINKPHAENKMMNKNYYDQLIIPRRFDTIVEEPTLQHANTVFGLNSEHGGELADQSGYAAGVGASNGNGLAMLSGDAIPADQRSNGGGSIYNQSQELIVSQRLGQTLSLQLGSALRRINTKLSGGQVSKRSNTQSRAGNNNSNLSKRRANKAPGGRGQSLGTDRRPTKGKPSNLQSQTQAQVRSTQGAPVGQPGSNNNSAQVKRVGNSATAVKEINYFLPRPEALTEKQILKRLNNEVKKSRVFSSVHFSKLPAKIGKEGEKMFVDPVAEAKNKKKKKRLNAGLQGLIDQAHKIDEEGDDEFSETSQEEPVVNDDYFVDRELNYLDQIQTAKEAAKHRAIDKAEWSGQDIMQRFDPYKARLALSSLSKIRVWPSGPYGTLKRSRVALKKLMKGSFVENFMTACVFANTVVLALDYYGIDPTTADVLTICNTFFTIVFAVEMSLKITAIGITKFLRDKLNYMDAIIVILSLIELIFLSGKGALKALRSVRIIRAFRVLRVARLLRGLKSMMNIIAVIQRSFSSFMYLALLLFLFIFIYALLGMQLFGGNFNVTEAPYRYNFDSFNKAFITSFVLLSTENWNSVLYLAIGGSTNKFISAIYFISCIFIGNYMLLNLFLAILLDAFTAVEEEDHDTPEKRAAREKQRIKGMHQKEGEDYIEGLEEIDMDQASKFGNAKGGKRKKKKKPAQSSNKSGNGAAPVSNILDESVEIDLETLYAKQQELKEVNKQIFRGIECEDAIYIFSKKNIIRRLIYRLVTNPRFETFILIVIILSTTKLILDSYTNQLKNDDPIIVLSDNTDFVFTAIFGTEMMLKVIAFGFIMEANSYLRESWSQLDCFIVITSLIDAMLVNVNLPIIKVLRLLRILRPLRFISHNSSMKTVVVALFSSMGAILNVGVVIIVVFLMFAILGVNLFAGKLQYCSVNTYNVVDNSQCFKNRGEWLNFHQHFDNVPRAMITLFVIANQEGWPDVMYQYVDITGVATGPQHGATPANAYFFIAFVFVSTFFFMNLFVGVLFMNFEAAQRDEKEALLLDGEEMKWVDMMKMIVNTKPEIVKTPKNWISQFLFKFTKQDSYFDRIIMVCIILNMLQMAMSYEGSTDTYQRSLDIANYFFTACFTLECILKIVANGSAYFIPNWNRFDMFVVMASYLDIVLNQLSQAALKPLRVAPQILRILRVLRVSRLFKLLNKYKGLQALLQTITFALPSLMNVFALLVLVYFIFAILGVFMYQNITSGKIIDPIYMNFTNFHQALIMLLRVSTGEDWPTIMYDTMNTSSDCIPGQTCGITYSPVFFIMFQLICYYVMLNLFVLIILQQFELYYLPQDNILLQFRDDLEKFKIIWLKFSKDHEGIKIKSLDLVHFFKDLEGNLGMKDDPEKTVMRNLVKMNLEGDDEGFIFFNELLFKAMKRIYGKERTKKRMLVDFELKTLEKLQKLKLKQQMSSRKKQRLQAVTVNPFLTVMYKNMSFKAWRNVYIGNKPRREDEVEYGLDRDSSDEELVKDDGYDYVYVTEEDQPCNSGDDEIIQEESSQNGSGDESGRADARKSSRFGIQSPSKFFKKDSKVLGTPQNNSPLKHYVPVSALSQDQERQSQEDPEEGGTKQQFQIKDMNYNQTEQRVLNDNFTRQQLQGQDSLTLGMRASADNFSSQVVDLRQAAQELNITLQDREDEPPIVATNSTEQRLMGKANRKSHIQSQELQIQQEDQILNEHQTQPRESRGGRADTQIIIRGNEILKRSLEQEGKPAQRKFQ